MEQTMLALILFVGMVATWFMLPGTSSHVVEELENLSTAPVQQPT